MPSSFAPVQYERSPALDLDELHALRGLAWGDPGTRRYGETELAHSLLWVAAFGDDGALVGFVNVAWDGGIHGFLIDTTVHPDHQRMGVGTALVRGALEGAREAGVEYVHVDHEPHLDGFYERAGFDRVHEHARGARLVD